MSPFVIGLIIESIILKSYLNIIVFLAFGIAGVIGETVFSLWWDLMFPKRFWVYTSSTIFNSYSSLLNFIPWGVGGFLFMLILNLLNLSVVNANIESTIKLPWYILFFGMYIFVLILTFIVAYLSTNRKRIRFEFKSVNILTYGVFILPIVIPVIVMSILYSINFLILFIIFGLVAFVAEYLFGKMCALFVSKKLWYYTYFTIDHNHTTPLNIIPFGMGGFYFWTVFLLVTTLLS